MKDTRILHWMGAALVCALGTTRSGQSAGSWLVRGGLTHCPQVSSGDLTAPSFAGTKVDVEADTQLSGVSYMLIADHWVVDVPLSLPFKRTTPWAQAPLRGRGQAGRGQGLAHHRGPAVPLSAGRRQWRPYLGMGLTYAKFFKNAVTAALTGLTGGSPATLLEAESRFIPDGANRRGCGLERALVTGPGLQDLREDAQHLSTGQHIDVKLNPNVFTVGWPTGSGAIATRLGRIPQRNAPRSGRLALEAPKRPTSGRAACRRRNCQTGDGPRAEIHLVGKHIGVHAGAGHQGGGAVHSAEFTWPVPMPMPLPASTEVHTGSAALVKK